jgi:hypothetical protein
MVEVGKWKDARYGIPIEHGNFQQMYINVDMFKKAGLNPDDPPKTMTAFLADLEADDSDPKGGEPTCGFAIRSKGHPVGITDKFLPFAHAWGARLLSPDLDKATGYANSPQMVAALTFFGDLVLKDKVATLAFGNPEDAFGQKRAAVIFRESWFFGWLKKNAPDVNFKVYALPCEKACPGAGALFPWTDLVYKNSPNKQMAWSSTGSSAIPRTTWSIISSRDTAGVDGEPRFRLREVLGPTISPRKTCSRSQCRRTISTRNRTSWPPPSVRPSWASCSAKGSRSPCWTKPPPRWIASSRTKQFVERRTAVAYTLGLRGVPTPRRKN